MNLYVKIIKTTLVNPAMNMGRRLSLQLVSIENLRMTGQNMAGGRAIFNVGEYNQVKAELSCYLQGTRCLAIH
jgi:hypothetical protein